MREDVAKRWIEALRSGKYKQGQGELNCNNNFCCLGVLCDLYKDELQIKTRVVECGVITVYDNATTLLPHSVRTFAEMKSTSGRLTKDLSLVSLNDNGKTFAEIADVIEQNIDNL